jgi:hypothetical protein
VWLTDLLFQSQTVLFGINLSGRCTCNGLGVFDSSWPPLSNRNSSNTRFLDVPICNTAVLGVGEGTGGKGGARGEVEVEGGDWVDEWGLGTEFTSTSS